MTTTAQRRGVKPRPAADRVLANVRIESGCWEWMGNRDKHGYGRVSGRHGESNRLCHRVVYEAFNGPLHAEIVLDHLCRTPWCVNPTHLEPVTQCENTRRGSHRWQEEQKARTHCPQGHEYTPENTRKSHNGGRTCRQCDRDSAARSNARKRGR